MYIIFKLNASLSISQLLRLHVLALYILFQIHAGFKYKKSDVFTYTKFYNQTATFQNEKNKCVDTPTNN